MRFNHLHPPFNNPAIRRALLGAVDQADVMSAVAGDRRYWHDKVGLFDPSSPLANAAGVEALSGPRDYDKVKRDLKEAGYSGQPVVVLGVSGNSLNVPISQVGSDMSREPPDRGGWNVFFTILDVLFNGTPATN
jgi:peptide/nickel transport system substrate-binding protein